MYTTRLLAELDSVMPRRHQVIAAALIVFLTIASIAGSVASRRAQPATAPASPIILIATPTPHSASAMGLAKRAAPQSAVSVLAAATVTPLPIIVQPAPQAVETDAQPAQHVGERPSDKPGPGEH